jgi:hypothetical protein
LYQSIAFDWIFEPFLMDPDAGPDKQFQILNLGPVLRGPQASR